MLLQTPWSYLVLQVHARSPVEQQQIPVIRWIFNKFANDFRKVFEKFLHVTSLELGYLEKIIEKYGLMNSFADYKHRLNAIKHN